MPSIFDRNPLPTRGQLNAVAERRCRDAEALIRTGNNERAAGAMYLLGYTIEVLLKGQLLSRFPAIGRVGEDLGSDEERAARALFWRSYVMEDMLIALPKVNVAVEKAGERAGRPYHRHLKQICQTWTPYARYSPRSTTIARAQSMLERVRNLKELLK